MGYIMKENLFIFELANNHQGSIKKAFNLISAAKRLSKSKYMNFAVKLQYRDLKTFIHKNANKNENKHINRFLETKLTTSEFSKICKKIKKNNFKLVITPFDENSVKRAVKDKCDFLKIASCSNKDWPLLEEVSKHNKPIICSTGGLNLDEIDNLYSFFSHKKLNFSLLHCVSIYPTDKMENFNIKFIGKMIRRYPDCKIGYSGHESEDNFIPVLTSLSLGSQIFERHFDISDDKNKYSINENNLRSLINYMNLYFKVLGNSEKIISPKETKNLSDLSRGLFAKKFLNKKSDISSKNTYFSFPKVKENQLEPGDLGKKIIINKKISKDDPVIASKKLQKENIIRKYVHRYKHMFLENKISFGINPKIELSHHYGLEKMSRFGACIITVINNSLYCKKLIALLPKQYHPKHKHYKKVETFHLLSGDLLVIKNGQKFHMKVGDKLDIFRDEVHEFYSNAGAIFEEISTEAIPHDSKYIDPVIDRKDTISRKTFIQKI